MSYEKIIGLEVTDQQEYQRYREAMLPILHRYGGSFGYDFKIAEVLASKGSDKINRVFTIAFDSESVLQAFFADPDYAAVRARHFEPSVASKVEIATVAE
jgi:uncharacterized protein (DUF1330 family)